MSYYSITEHTGTGVAANLAVPPYLDKSHIRVYIDGVPTTAFSWINDATVQVIIPTGKLCRVVRRTSPGVRLTQYANGQPLPGQDLEVDSKQAFYMAQEAYDLAVLGGSVGNVPAGVEATTQGLLDLLVGAITPSQLELSLRADIQLSIAPASTIGSPAWLVAQEAIARANAVQAEYDARVLAISGEAANRAAAIASEATLREDADGLLASQINTVAAQVDGANAAVQSEQTARADADTAIASDIDTIVAYIEDLEAGSGGPLADRIAAVEVEAEALATRLDGAEAKYTIKVQARSDGKEAIAGIGLVATANDDVAQSEMVFLADKFTFVPSLAGLNTTPQPLFVAGVVNGANTFVFPAQRLGDSFVESRMVVDGGIQARHMRITGGRGKALNEDPSCADETAWPAQTGHPSPVAVVLSDGAWGNTAIQVTGAGPHTASRKFPIKGDKWYRANARFRRVSGGGTTYFRLVFLNAAGGFLSSALGYEGFSPTTGVWHTFTASVQAPSTAVEAYFQLVSNYLDTGTSQWQHITCEEMLDASLVVEGGLSADRIDTRGLTIKRPDGTVILSSGQKLNGATDILAASVGTAEVGVLTAANLTVTALSNTVNGGATSGGRVVIDSNKVQVYDATNALRVKLGYLL